MNLPGLSFGDSPDDGELMGSLGDVEPEYVPSYLTSGPGGYPGSPQQTTDPSVYAAYMAKLRELGYDAPDSGNAYDPAVRAAVAEFQQANGLAADGLGGAGSMTFRRIDELYAQMSAPGPAVVYDDPPPFVPGDMPGGDVPVIPASDVEEPSSLGKWLAIGGVAAVGAFGAWYFWGK